MTLMRKVLMFSAFVAMFSVMIIHPVSAQSYRVGDPCASISHHAAGDVSHVADATVSAGSSGLESIGDNVSLDFDIPLSDYTDTSKSPVNFDETEIALGEITVKNPPDGAAEVALNGAALHGTPSDAQGILRTGCQ